VCDTDTEKVFSNYCSPGFGSNNDEHLIGHLTPLLLAQATELDFGEHNLGLRLDHFSGVDDTENEAKTDKDRELNSNSMDSKQGEVVPLDNETNPNNPFNTMSTRQEFFGTKHRRSTTTTSMDFPLTQPSPVTLATPVLQIVYSPRFPEPSIGEKEVSSVVENSIEEQGRNCGLLLPRGSTCRKLILPPIFSLPQPKPTKQSRKPFPKTKNDNKISSTNNGNQPSTLQTDDEIVELEAEAKITLERPTILPNESNQNRTRNKIKKIHQNHKKENQRKKKKGEQKEKKKKNLDKALKKFLQICLYGFNQGY